MYCAVWEPGQPTLHTSRLLKHCNLITQEALIKSNQAWDSPECHIISIQPVAQCRVLWITCVDACDVSSVLFHCARVCFVRVFPWMHAFHLFPSLPWVREIHCRYAERCLSCVFLHSRRRPPEAPPTTHLASVWFIRHSAPQTAWWVTAGHLCPHFKGLTAVTASIGSVDLLPSPVLILLPSASPLLWAAGHKWLRLIFNHPFEMFDLHLYLNNPYTGNHSRRRTVSVHTTHKMSLNPPYKSNLIQDFLNFVTQNFRLF